MKINNLNSKNLGYINGGGICLCYAPAKKIMHNPGREKYDVYPLMEKALNNIETVKQCKTSCCAPALNKNIIFCKYLPQKRGFYIQIWCNQTI